MPRNNSRVRGERTPQVRGEEAQLEPALRTPIPSRLEEDLRQKAELVDLSREAIFVTDSQGGIVLWNHGAEKVYGWSQEEAQGKNPVELLHSELPRSVAQIENILRQEGHWDCELRQTTRDGSRITVASRWALWRNTQDQILGRFQLDTDISKRKQVEQELRVLSGRLLNLQDEERRRFARDLHDSVGQLLAGAAMNLSLVQQRVLQLDPEVVKLLSEGNGLLDEALREIRTLSYLLHPPLLDEVGLISALRWYVSGFAERSQIKVELEVPENLGRFRRELELALFRIVQESLTNVHRHSGSASAKIMIACLPNQLRLKVEDAGKGMSTPLIAHEKVSPGVGISGMRERVRQLGGQIQIRSGNWGTAVEVLFPLEEPAPNVGVTAVG
jgi:PAS domain S-box-containing protein